MSANVRDVICSHIKKSIEIKSKILNDPKISDQIATLAENCLCSLKAGGKIIFSGNGGSFADAQHLSAEFTSRFLFDRNPMPSLVLGANNSTITAIANDYGYEHVFERELIGIAKIGDIFIPFSTSGNSPNILSAVIAAKKMGISTIAFSGATGGKLKQLCETVCIPSDITAHIQESHIMLGHILCDLVESQFFKT